MSYLNRASRVQHVNFHAALYLFAMANISSNGSPYGNGIGILPQPRVPPYTAWQAGRLPGEFVFVIVFDIDMWFTFCLSNFSLCVRTLCQP